MFLVLGTSRAEKVHTIAARSQHDFDYSNYEEFPKFSEGWYKVFLKFCDTFNSEKYAIAASDRFFGEDKNYTKHKVKNLGMYNLLVKTIWAKEYS